MKTLYILIATVVLGLTSCKTSTKPVSHLELFDGVEGQACRNIDVMSVYANDRPKAIRIMGFLYRMMLRGSERAGTLFLAAVEGIKFEDYLKLVDKAIKSKGLLAANDGGRKELFSDPNRPDMDRAVNGDVERRVMTEILSKAESGVTFKLKQNSRGVNLAIMAQRFGEIAKSAMASDPSLKSNLQTEIQSIITSIMEIEASDVEQGKARARSRVLLDQWVDASRYAGLETQVTDPATGKIKRVSAVNDAFFTKAYVNAMTNMANSMLSANSKNGVNKMDFFYRDFAALAGGEAVLEGTGLRELTETLRKDPNSEEYRKLQREGKLRVGNREVSLDEITNADAIISKLKESGRGEYLMDAMRKKYGGEIERLR